MRRRGFLDVTPLTSSPPFRRWWSTGLVSVMGGQLMFVAVLFQVWELTGSPVWTGMIGLVRAVPLVVFGILGGALADAVDRRSIALVSQLLQLGVAAGLGAHALLGSESVGALLGLVGAGAGLGAVAAPASRTFLPRLLPRDQVAAGVALRHLGFQFAMLLGPAIGGAALARWNAGVCFGLYAGAIVVGLYGVLRLPRMPVQRQGRQLTFRAIAGGFAFVARRPVLRGSFATDLAATLLAMPIALFPLINDLRFGGNPATLGLFLSAIALGGMLAGLTSGWATRADRQGVIQLWSAAIWGLALAAFGLAGPLWLALAMLVIAGAADTISVVSRGGIVQVSTPDSHRGRVSALEHAVGAAGPELGNLRAGLIAGATSAAGALAGGGLACLAVVGWVAWRNPDLRRYRTSEQRGDDPNASEDQDS